MEDINYETIYVETTAGKSYVSGDVIVDDDPRNLIPVGNRVSICIARPWNKEFRDKYPEIKVIKDLRDLPLEIEKLRW